MWEVTVQGRNLWLVYDSGLTAAQLEGISGVGSICLSCSRGLSTIQSMSKPILDELEQIVYDDDRQIIQAEIVHLKIGAAFTIAGVSKILVTALQAGLQFVYVRIEDPVDPFPLPK